MVVGHGLRKSRADFRKQNDKYAFAYPLFFHNVIVIDIRLIARSAATNPRANVVVVVVILHGRAHDDDARSMTFKSRVCVCV